MAMAQPVERGKGYTYADYLTWNDDKRWEIIDGVAYEKKEGPSVVSDMTPAPGRRHQLISGRLFAAIFNFLKGKSAQVYSAPFDVVLKRENNTSAQTVVVQPDLSIFYSDKNLDDKGATGAPDWIIEILSPSTASRDLGTKLLLYQNFQVKEYWIVDPDKKIVSVFTLGGDARYAIGNEYKNEDHIAPSLFPGLEIDLREIFAA